MLAGLVHPLYNEVSLILFSHTLSRLAFKLFGFSTDTFTEFYRIDTGKSSVPYDVRNNLKSLFTDPGSDCMSSNWFSSIFRNVTLK